MQHLLTIGGKEERQEEDDQMTPESEDSPSPGPPPQEIMVAQSVRRGSKDLSSTARRGSKDIFTERRSSKDLSRRSSKGNPTNDIWPVCPVNLEAKPIKDILPTPPSSPVKKEPEKPVMEEKKPEEDWKETMRRMREQIKQVQELPTIEVPTLLKKMTSASSPDLTLYSSGTKTSRVESSWEIRARYRNMKTEELYQSQLVKKSGYSWRDKVPEIQNQKLKFTEVRSNAVTDTAFIGATYVEV